MKNHFVQFRKKLLGNGKSFRSQLRKIIREWKSFHEKTTKKFILCNLWIFYKFKAFAKSDFFPSVKKSIKISLRKKPITNNKNILNNQKSINNNKKTNKTNKKIINRKHQHEIQHPFHLLDYPRYRFFRGCNTNWRFW